MVNLKLTPRKIRFSIVSSSATAIDFAILLTLVHFGAHIIMANFISTSISFVFNFFASKKYAFKTPDRQIKREAVLFVIITLFGIWVIQPLIIWPLEPLIADFGIHGLLVATSAKLVASLATFIWNYLLYTRVVFKKKK